MIRLFLGLALILFDVTIKIKGIHIDALPDFIGYFLILMSMKDFQKGSSRFKNKQVQVFVLMLYSLIYFSVYAIGLIGQVENLLFYFMQLIDIVAGLYTSYLVVAGYKEILAKYGYDISTKALEVTWKVQAGVSLIFLILRMTMVTFQTVKKTYAITFIVTSFAHILLSLIVVIFLLFFYNNIVKYYSQRG